MIYSVALTVIVKKYEKMVMYSALIISALRFVFDKSVYSLSFWAYFLLFVIIIKLVFQSLLLKMITKSSIIYLDKKELNKGVTLAYTIINTKKGLLLNKDEKNNIINEKDIWMKKDIMLDEKEIKMLMKRNIDFKIPVYKKMPFAHIMFIGVLITIIIKGNILIYLLNLFK